MSDEHTTSEERALAFFATVDVRTARLDLFANASPIEVRMMGRWRA